MKTIIEKAKKYGMAMAAIRNSALYGIAGYWASMAVHEGMIGITGTNARPSIAPTFGVENMLGTNPLTGGMPTDEDFPFMLDCATSISQRGKIEYYARSGKDTPAGMVIGRDGSAMTDSPPPSSRALRTAPPPSRRGRHREDLAGSRLRLRAVVEILSLRSSGRLPQDVVDPRRKLQQKPTTSATSSSFRSGSVLRLEVQKISGEISASSAFEKARTNAHLYRGRKRARLLAREARQGVRSHEALQKEFSPFATRRTCPTVPV
jgi:LDH2 family malate/lactate/ureidoglycolate dehydrogenase